VYPFISVSRLYRQRRLPIHFSLMKTILIALALAVVSVFFAPIARADMSKSEWEDFESYLANYGWKHIFDRKVILPVGPTSAPVVVRVYQHLDPNGLALVDADAPDRLTASTWFVATQTAFEFSRQMLNKEQ
jgi:hypothetical protein